MLELLNQLDGFDSKGDVKVICLINIIRDSKFLKIQTTLVSIHFLIAVIEWENLLKDDSNFYLVIMSLILITFSLDLCIDTVRRNLMLVTLGA